MKRPTLGPVEYSPEGCENQVAHRYVHSTVGPIQRETYVRRNNNSWGATPQVVRFVSSYKGGPTAYIDSDGTIDVAVPHITGKPWFTYRAAEGSGKWFALSFLFWVF